MLNAQLTPATSNRIVRSLALRTQAAGNDDFIAAPHRSIMAMRCSMPINPGPTRKASCNPGSVSSISPLINPFKTALSSGDPKDFEKIVLGGPAPSTGRGRPRVLSAMSGWKSVRRAAGARAGQRGLRHQTCRALLGVAASGRRVHGLFHEHDRREGSGRTNLAARVRRPAERGEQGDPRSVVPRRRNRRAISRGDRRPTRSQFLLQPTSLGSLPIVQRYMTNKAGVDFMLDPTSSSWCRTESRPERA